MIPHGLPPWATTPHVTRDPSPAAAVGGLSVVPWIVRATVETRRRIGLDEERGGMMRISWLFLTVAFGSLAISGCSETAGDTAYNDNRRAAERLCLSAVSKRTGNGDVAVVRTYSRDKSTAVWVGVGPQRSQWQCSVENNGPSSYYIQTIHKV